MWFEANYIKSHYHIFYHYHYKYKYVILLEICDININYKHVIITITYLKILKALLLVELFGKSILQFGNC